MDSHLQTFIDPWDNIQISNLSLDLDEVLAALNGFPPDEIIKRVSAEYLLETRAPAEAAEKVIETLITRQKEYDGSCRHGPVVEREVLSLPQLFQLVADERQPALKEKYVRSRLETMIEHKLGDDEFALMAELAYRLGVLESVRDVIDTHLQGRVSEFASNPAKTGGAADKFYNVLLPAVEAAGIEVESLRQQFEESVSQDALAESWRARLDGDLEFEQFDSILRSPALWSELKDHPRVKKHFLDLIRNCHARLDTPPSAAWRLLKWGAGLVRIPFGEPELELHESSKIVLTAPSYPDELSYLCDSKTAKTAFLYVFRCYEKARHKAAEFAEVFLGNSVTECLIEVLPEIMCLTGNQGGIQGLEELSRLFDLTPALSAALDVAEVRLRKEIDHARDADSVDEALYYINRVKELRRYVAETLVAFPDELALS